MTAVVEPPVARLAALPGVSTASRVGPRAERAGVLPVVPALAGLLPDTGLRRGSTVAVHGGTSLLLALLASATTSGSWAAVVGMPSLGVAAAAEYGVDVTRLALVPHPGVELPAVVAALLDGVDLVALQPETLQPAVARRLSARARHRGAVLLSAGAWPGADVELACRREQWSGPASGYGHLQSRRVEVRAHGRGAAARPRRASLHLPAADGSVTPAPHGPPRYARPPHDRPDTPPHAKPPQSRVSPLQSRVSPLQSREMRAQSRDPTAWVRRPTRRGREPTVHVRRPTL